jgi:general secretion pathway protein I
MCVERRSQGFTLIEALVALAIVSLGMMAVNTQLNRYAVAAAQTQQKTLASWIATNKLTEISVGGTWPEIGDYDDDVDFAGQRWRCEFTVSKTDVDNLRRVDVSVSLADAPERVIHKMSALVEPPAPPGFQPPSWTLPGAGRGGERGGGERG